MPPPLGFILVTHTAPAQALFLCQRLNSMFGDPPIAIHHDFSQYTLPKELFPDNVRFVERWVRTGWGEIGVVQGVLKALNLLYNSADPSFGNPDWVVSLSATDYPIQTARTILEDLRTTPFDAFMDLREVHDTGEPFRDEKLGEFPFQQPRYLQVAFNRYLATPLLPRRVAETLNIPVEKYTLRWPWLTRQRSPFRDGYKCFAGDAWFTASRKAARALIAETPQHKQLLRYLRHRSVPEECFYHTVIGNTPGLKIAETSLRYTDWREEHAHPRTLGYNDIPRLLTAKEHFARKFPWDPVLLEDLDRAVASQGPRTAPRTPAVCVVIPSYNCADLLPKAIESVLAQTYTDYEIVVVDDGSTDDTAAAIQPYLSRVRYIRQENKGLPGARNRGIRSTQAEFIALLDADDAWLPNKLERQMPRFADPEVTMVYSDFSVNYASGASKASYLSERPLASEGWVFNAYIRSRFLFPSTMVLRRRAMETFRLFSEDMLACEDIELFARMCLRGKVAWVREVLMVRWEGAGNITANQAKLNLYTIRALHKILGTERSMSAENRRVVKRELAQQYWWAGYASFKDGRLADARNQFARAVRYDPFRYRAAVLFAATMLPARLLGKLRHSD